MMRKIGIIFVIVLLLVCCGLVVAEANTLWLDPSSVDISNNGEFVLDLKANSDKLEYAAYIEISYDPSYLSFDTHNLPSGFEYPEKNKLTNTNGVITFGVIKGSFAELNTINTDFSLGTLSFKAIKEGNSEVKIIKFSQLSGITASKSSNLKIIAATNTPKKYKESCTTNDDCISAKCFNGKCACADSDADEKHPDGKNYFVEGKFPGSYQYDTCYQNSGYLKEFFCKLDGTMDSENYVCPNKCLMGTGICIQTVSPTCLDQDSGMVTAADQNGDINYASSIEYTISTGEKKTAADYCNAEAGSSSTYFGKTGVEMTCTNNEPTSKSFTCATDRICYKGGCMPKCRIVEEDFNADGVADKKTGAEYLVETSITTEGSATITNYKWETVKDGCVVENNQAKINTYSCEGIKLKTESVSCPDGCAAGSMVCNQASSPKCPDGSTGNPPGCVCLDSGYTYNSATNSCDKNEPPTAKGNYYILIWRIEGVLTDQCQVSISEADKKYYCNSEIDTKVEKISAIAVALKEYFG
jgi:hypothetical protein